MSASPIGFPLHSGIRHKYRAKPMHVDNIRFASKREASHYTALELAKRSGALLFYLRQAPLHLPGGTRLVIDFIEFWADGTVRFRDAKGFETDAFKIKKREIEAVYPIEIETV